MAGSMADVPKDLAEEIHKLEKLFTVDGAKLKEITNHFVSELAKGLSVEGGSIPMNPTWVMSFPDGYETGTYLALDMGGTNLRVCQITLTDEKSEFDIIQSKYRMPEELKSATSEELWEYIADCLYQFLETHHGDCSHMEKLPLGFTFSYPATQNYIDEGILQRWTKGFDIDGVEGQNIVPMFEEALTKRGVPIKLAAIINDTTGTLIASAYTDPAMKIGCIFGTGCNAAYMENCGSIPKIAHLNLPPDLPMAINCEWGAFDNEHKVLPRTPYDIIIDKESPRPGQQAFEKMIAGLYLGEILRLIMVDLHDNKNVHIFEGQDIALLRKPYSLDASFLSFIEEDPFENLQETHDLFSNKLNLACTRPELELIRKTAELIGTRAARLSACGVAAVCKKKNYETCHVGADGSVFNKYPYFKERGAQALREILDWPKKTNKRAEDPVEILAAEDGSGVGAALIAALTLKRINEGNMAAVIRVFGAEDDDDPTSCCEVRICRESAPWTCRIAGNSFEAISFDVAAIPSSISSVNPRVQRQLSPAPPMLIQSDVGRKTTTSTPPTAHLNENENDERPQINRQILTLNSLFNPSQSKASSASRVIIRGDACMPPSRPLVIVSGLPTSGKSTRAKQLHDYLAKRIVDTKYRLHLVSDESLSISRAVYDLSPDKLPAHTRSANASEKDARAALYGAVKRVLSDKDIVILDGLNYIKGWRYQLHCEAKAVRTPSCILQIGCSIDRAKQVNEERLRRREAGDKTIDTTDAAPSDTTDVHDDVAEPYEPSNWDNLVFRYEEPNPMTRWDSPLFTLIWEDDEAQTEKVFSDLWDAIAGEARKVVRPNQAIRPAWP
ncbi:hypothetical protein NM208_g14619 [Fusarium decemcellulare]|uniref:Uncharacterized protein n=1 Tax=Fusarium decemcellulare TaxID=57161 RepID=A0ACC1RFZ9_9HYPO|nr:hypothetical protein NM208_g14619 [Fusarium decemcellulare]